MSGKQVAIMVGRFGDYPSDDRLEVAKTNLGRGNPRAAQIKSAWHVNVYGEEPADGYCAYVLRTTDDAPQPPRGGKIKSERAQVL